MRWTIRVFTSSVVVMCLAVLFAYGQATKAGPAQQSLEVPLQQRVAALEKEVRSLKAELAALRAQIQRSGSAQAPVASGGGSRPDGARPSETEIRACVATARTPTDRAYGQLGGVMEFGTTITSQGGLGEPAKGTSIFPIRFHTPERARAVWDFWAFKDSFGKLTCEGR
jgi:hypothetical protein